MRIIQYNLQMKDTPHMDPERIAQQTKEMGGNVAVINAVDSVVWYPSKAAKQIMNPFLPTGRDLLEELINAFHRCGIKVIARGAHLGFEEDTYYQHPEWVCRDPEGTPVMMANDRPGLWKRLYVPCPNSAFVQENARDVAKEIFTAYDFDGAFWWGHGMPCFCDTCKRCFREKMGYEMPSDPKLIPDGWDADLRRQDAILLKKTILETRNEEMPYFHYFWPIERFDSYENFTGVRPAENIEEKADITNTLLTEAQDVLSRGVRNLPEWNMGTLEMKLGSTIESFPPPVGIIHTCPGMDWRHANLPENEFLFWASQIPANGGSYWTAFTGFPDTITDKRMLRSVGLLNHMAQKCEADMRGAKTFAQVLLLSDGNLFNKGWAEALTAAHIEFDMLAHYQLSLARMEDYPLVIAPQKFKYLPGFGEIFQKYLDMGGHLIVEGTSSSELTEVKHLLGIEGDLCQSEEVSASYLRCEDAEINQYIGEVQLVPLKGRIGFSHPAAGTQTIASWVPQFAPPNWAGAPPERASLPAPKTRIPLVTRHTECRGEVLFVSYEASRLVLEYGLWDMYDLMRYYIDTMLGSAKKIQAELPRRVIMTVFEKEKKLLIHFVNGVGQRPLTETIPIYHIVVRIQLEGKKVKSVLSRIAEEALEYSQDGDVLTIRLCKLQIWDMVCIIFE